MEEEQRERCAERRLGRVDLLRLKRCGEQQPHPATAALFNNITS